MKRWLIRTLWALLPVLVSTGAGRAEDPPVQIITTDTPEYCVTLQQMVEGLHSPMPEVKHLLNEGRLMCDHGDIRPGIARLRRALILGRHQVIPQTP